MKRCYICNYRARTLDRLRMNENNVGRPYYKCDDEHEEQCRQRAREREKKNREKDN